MLSSNDDLDHVSSSFKSPKLWAAHNIHSDQIKIDFNSYMATNIGLQYVIDNIWVSVKYISSSFKINSIFIMPDCKKKDITYSVCFKTHNCYVSRTMYNVLFQSSIYRLTFLDSWILHHYSSAFID